MAKTNQQHAAIHALATIAAFCMPAAAILAIFVLAPTEQTMQAAQKIVYVHVSVAWCSMLAFLGMAGTGGIYLLRRNLDWDHWAEALAEVGWLCCTLTLVTGSFWARAAWGTWWTWDPRLTTTFVLWALYAGCLLVRHGQDDPHRRARLCAVLAILGAADIPLLVTATRWLRGIHPVAPQMAPEMRIVLLASMVGFSGLFATLLWRRRSQIRQERAVGELEFSVGQAVPDMDNQPFRPSGTA